jgi:hypothetical protein
VLRPPWGAGLIVVGGSLIATGPASVLAAVADLPPTGVAGPEDPPPPIPPSQVVDPPPPPPPVAHQGYTVAALTAARAEHAARQARLREAALMWERKREAADAIAAQIAAAEQLLTSPATHDGGVTSSDTMGGVYGVPLAPTVGTGPRTIPTVLWHDPADPLVAQLHIQAGSVQNIRLMVPVILEPESSSYARWRDLLLLTLHHYALDDHILCDPAGVAPTAAWVRLDNIMLTRIVGTISADLHSLLRNLPHARAVWLALEGQFLGNAEARALRLDAAFRTFVQGDLSVSEYCRKMKTMADSLGDLDCPMEDHNLVLNVLRGLSERYTHLRSLLMRQHPFPTFLQVRDDLALEEITLGAQATLISGPGSSSSSTALAALTPTRPPTPSGHRPPGPNMGGGVAMAEVGAVVVVAAVVVAVVRVVLVPAVVLVAAHRHRDPNRVRLGPLSTTRGQGASPCGRSRGLFPRLVPRWPCSLVHSRGSPRRRGSPSPWPPSPAASSWPTPPATPPSGLVGWDATALAAFQTPTLTPPLGPEWTADTGATYHTTPDPGILTSVCPPPSSLPSSIMVANGSCLPVTSVGVVGPPGSFRMPDVLVAPLVHNLLSIRRFTTDNSCSVEFDSSGLTVKDSTTRRPLLRCDSSGSLYTIRLPHATSSSSSPPDTAVVFVATTTSTTWHRRLGHPGRDALMQLTRSATIPCTRSPEEHLCHACHRPPCSSSIFLFFLACYSCV